jgi:hypothetical protein
MSNLRQSMTDEEWNNPSSLPKIHYTRSEVKQLIYEFTKDAMITDVPSTDVWINNWIERKLEL